MLKAITNFVVERRRLVRQRRRQVVGEANSDGAASHREVVPQQEVDNSDPLSHPEVPPQLGEPQLGEPLGRAHQHRVDDPDDPDDQRQADGHQQECIDLPHQRAEIRLRLAHAPGVEAGMRLLKRPQAFSLHVNRQIMRYLGRSDAAWRKYLFYVSDTVECEL